jgi:2-dehydropantoate 2-reductase
MVLASGATMIRIGRDKKFHHLERGRRTEIDALNGYVARESRRLGLAAPYSEALMMLMKGRERQPLHPDGSDA